MAPLLPILALAALASSVETRWKHVDGPTVGPIRCFAVAPARAGGLVASVRISAANQLYTPYPGAQLAWSRRGSEWTTRWSSAFPQLVDLERDPTRQGVLWGANYESILKSLDGGISWITAWNPVNPVEALAVDPMDPDRVYGVGEPTDGEGEFHRTHDGGRSWEDLAHFLVDFSEVAVTGGSAPSSVLAAGPGGVQRSIDHGRTFSPVLAVSLAEQLAVAADDTRIVWCLARDASHSTELHRSLDGGRTFARVSSPAGELSAVAAHPTDPRIAFVATRSAGVHSTFDGGRSWIRGAGIPDTAYVRSIRLDPEDSSHLYGAGTGSQGGMWSSRDSGLHWESANSGLFSSIPDLLLDRTGRLYASGLGVPIRRASADARWEILDHPRGSTTSVRDLAIDPTQPSRIAWIDDVEPYYVANELWLSSDDGRTWEDWTPPAAHDAAFEVLVLAFDREGTLYAMSRFGHFFRRSAGSTRWSNHEGPWLEATEFVPDPSDAAVIHATDNTLYYRSTDGGRNRITGAAGLEGAYYFDDLSVNPLDSDEVYLIAYADPTTKRLYRSADRGASFAPVGSELAGYDLVHLALDPRVDGRLLVGTRGGDVFVSANHGRSFTRWSEGLDEAPILSIAFDPTRAGVAFASQAGGGLFERGLP